METRTGTTAPAKTVEAKTEQRHGIARIDSSQKAGAMVKSAAADQIVTRHGRLARVVSDVQLRLSAGEIYTIDKGSSFIIQADGYRKLNDVAGMQIVDTPCVVVDGQSVPNPHIVRDQKSGVITDIFIRRGIVGRAQNGNLQALTQTIHYSPETYFRAELFSAVKKKERWSDEANGYVADKDWSDAGRLAPIVYVDGEPQLRDGSLNENEVIYPLDEKIGMVVDLRSGDIADVLANRNENFKFALRKIQTIIDRRLMSAHPGMPRPKIPGSSVVVTRGDVGRRRNVIIEAVATLRVMGWVELDARAMVAPLQIANAMQNGDEIDARDLVQELRESSAKPVGADDEEEIAAENLAPVQTTARVIDAETSPAAESQRPSEQSATPNPASVKQALVESIRLNLAQIRKQKNGARIASDLINAHTDGESELIDHKEDQLRNLLAASVQALADAKKS